MESDAHRVVNATMRTFGAPRTVVHDYAHWCVLLRGRQVTLGALVLIARDEATAFSELSAPAFAELKQVTADLEQALSRAFHFEKINYLMLMMVDPDVHFHVIPRYSGPRDWGGREFLDPGWPGPPRLDAVNDTDGPLNDALRDELIARWPT